MKTVFVFLMLAVFTSLGSLPSFAQNQLGGDIDGEAAHDNTGYSISLSSDGQKVAIGAYLNDGNGENAGSDLSAGIYYLQINTERGLFNSRIIKL